MSAHLVGWLGWIAAAYAEENAVESLAWKVWDSDVVVRATVARVTPRPFDRPTPGVVREEVTVRVDELLHGLPVGEELTWTWQALANHAYGGRAGSSVLLFLVRADDGSLVPRSIDQGSVDLAQPRPATATTADCDVLRSGDDVLAHVRALPARPGALTSTRPAGPVRRECGTETRGYWENWLGSGVSVLVPLGDLDALARPRLHLASLTEPMHWFGVGAMAIEWVGCTVGIPVDGTGEPLVACVVPGGAGEGTDTPRELGAAERAARLAVRSYFADDPVAPTRATRLTVRYQGTEQRAALCDHSLGFDAWPGWATGHLSVGLSDGTARIAPSFGHGALSGMTGCAGRPLAWEEPEGTPSMLYQQLVGEEPGVTGTRALIDALPGVLSGVAPFGAPDAADGRWTQAPTRLVRGPDGRPQPGGDGFRVPLPADPARPVWTRLRYLASEGGRPYVVGDVMVSGVPTDWAVAAGPALPAGVAVTAILEVFATAAEGGPRTPAGEPEGFERLAIWSMLGVTL